MTKKELLAALRQPGEVKGAVLAPTQDVTYLPLVKSAVIEFVKECGDSTLFNVSISNGTIYIG